MILVIDAYNVLKQRTDAEYITKQEQKDFIEELAAYARRKNHSIIVVFDGGPYHWPSQKTKGPVTVIYSGAQSSADEIIKKCLDRVDAHNSALVSSDRDLCTYANRHGVPSIDSRDFSHFLKTPDDTVLRIVKTNQQAIKQHEGVQFELDKLMEKASRIIVYKDEDLQESVPRKKSAQKPSKREKKLERLVKKL